jgi:cytochrome c553
MRLVFAMCFISLIGLKSASAQPHPGEADFTTVCGVCHGPQGRGQGEAPALVPMDRETDEVLGIVREGFGMMPPISSRELSDNQVAQIVEYLKSQTASGARSSASRSGASSTNDSQDVLATLESMADATLEKDATTLARLYHDDLRYTAASGPSQTKSERLKAVASGGAVESKNFRGATVQVYGPVALLHQSTPLPEGSDNKTNDGVVDILWVLLKGPQGWQIVGRHATRIAP